MSLSAVRVVPLVQSILFHLLSNCACCVCRRQALRRAYVQREDSEDQLSIPTLCSKPHLARSCSPDAMPVVAACNLPQVPHVSPLAWYGIQTWLWVHVLYMFAAGSTRSAASCVNTHFAVSSVWHSDVALLFRMFRRWDLPLAHLKLHTFCR